MTNTETNSNSYTNNPTDNSFEASEKTRDKALADIRLPPHSVEAESAVLGGLLIDNSAMERIIDVLQADDFYRPDHALIFKEIVRLIDQNRAADVLTVFESLKASQKDQLCGGLNYLNHLAQSVPMASHIRRYAELVRERAVLRKLVSTCEDIADSAMNSAGKESAQILDEAEAKIFAIGENAKRQTTGFMQIPQLMEKAIERVDELYHQNNPDDVTGIPTGFSDLDQMTAGLQPGDLIIVAGRPSMGKTAFSLNMAEYIAIEQGLPVAVFSMEMSAQQLALRMLGSLARVNQGKLRTGRITDDDWPKLMEAVTKAQRAPLFIDETAGLNSFELRSRARRLARTCGKLGLIVVDYLQLMSSSSRGENRATEISEISRSLKSLAKELQCPLIALSQLNRSLEQRPDKRPIMSDLRESGAIEQDADLILFIYRDEVYNKDSRDKGVAEIKIGKQRNGPTGTVRMTFLGEYTRFENYASQGSGWEPE